MLVKNVTMLGHKDHGKSTLIGSILMLTKSVSNARIKEAQKYSKKLGKPFEPAFILDSFEEERKGGLTIDTTRAEVKYKDLAFEMIDVPGHEELIKNMMSGASFADAAVLLVSAKPEEGIKDQTKRHIFVAKMLGVEKLVVAVNKMDMVNYNIEEYKKISNEIKLFLDKIGFGKNVEFVPISAYNGENIIKKSSKMKWYKGMPLLEVLYKMAKRKDKLTKSELRALIQGQINSNAATTLGVKVLSGVLKPGFVGISPQGFERNISKIVVNGKKVKKAVAGESAAIDINAPIENPRGSVLLNGTPVVGKDIRALLFTVAKLKNNSKLSIRILGKEIKGSIKIIEIIEASSGTKIGGKEIASLDAGIVNIKLNKPIPFEKYADVKELGRFSFYVGKKFCGIGIII
ncbi:MAG: GTP-binding protein [Candidatus Micrarchaeia archaeon]